MQTAFFQSEMKEEAYVKQTVGFETLDVNGQPIYIIAPLRSLRTHLPTVIQGFRADAHGSTMKYTLVVGVARIVLVLMIFCSCLHFTLNDIFIPVSYTHLTLPTKA